MLIAVFGDIHGNLPALEAVIADAENLGVDAWVCLGDVAFRGPQPVECIEAVAKLPGITQIVGNTDQWLFQGFPSGFSLPEERMQMLVSFREWALARLQPRHLERLQNARFSHSLTLDNREVLFFHSSPSSTESWLPSSFSEEELSPLVTNHTADVVVDGHIHTPFIRQVGGRTVINTGSVGHPTDGDNRASYLLIESKLGITSLQLRRVPYRWQDTVARARELGMPAADDYARALEYANAL